MLQCEHCAGEGQARRGRGLFNLTYSKQSVLEGEVAVNVGDVNPEVLAPRNLACAQVEPVVDDGQHCLLNFFLQVPGKYLRGRQRSKTPTMITMLGFSTFCK